LDENVNAVLLWSEGKVFTAGLDLKSAMNGPLSSSTDGEDRARQNLKIWRTVKKWQKDFSQIQRCAKPVIAAIHSKCIGGGVDLACWCDIRVCTKDAEFSVKEIQLAMVADIGTLQRIGKLTSKGFAREMAFSGVPVSADRVLKHGFVNEVYSTKEDMLVAARELAQKIAANSPLALQGTKIALNYTDEHNEADSLNQVALWNSAFLQSDDLLESFASFMEKRKAIFKKSKL